jgi:hypothetical protein
VPIDEAPVASLVAQLAARMATTRKRKAKNRSDTEKTMRAA